MALDTTAAEDLQLLRSAAVTAGIIATGYFRKDLKTWTKEFGSPVSEADIVLDKFLHSALTPARPDYGWLSEGPADTPDRLNQRRCFVVDPIDGTRGFIKGEDSWSVSLAVVEDVSDTNAAVARGVALGLHRQDVVARERLLADARELLLGDLPEDAATDEEARAFLAANAPLYALPARVQFKQLFLSRDKRGALLGRDAAEMKRRLAVADVASADAWAWTAPAGHYTEARLDAIAGPGFGALVMSAPVGVWTGPIESSFGLHFAWVTARTPASAAPLSVALPRARADLAVRAREQARKARLQQLREGYAVSWVRR